MFERPSNVSVSTQIAVTTDPRLVDCVLGYRAAAIERKLCIRVEWFVSVKGEHLCTV